MGRIDDSDSSVEYRGDWKRSGDVAHEYKGTTHGTSKEGAQAIFNFNGTSISVFGTVGKSDEPPTSAYSVDGGPLNRYVANKTQVTLYKQEFFRSQILQSGRHKLVIDLIETSSAHLWLDYFVVQDSDAASIVADNATSLPTPVSLHTLLSSVVLTSTVTLSPARVGFTTFTTTVSQRKSLGELPASSSSLTSFEIPSSSATLPSTPETSSTSFVSSSPNNKGAIAGGVVGGLLLLGLLIAFIIYRRKRKPPPAYTPTDPPPGWTPRAIWTNEKLTMRRNGFL